MQRDIAAMAAREYDLIVVGGGATGASIAWDATQRGLQVALLEKDDFGHGTSAGSSKMIHGGLRYLQNGEFRLVREALAERRIWCVVAPHLVDPLPFIMPTHGWGQQSRLLMSLGLALYDLLSFDRNRLQDDDKKLPGARQLSHAQALEIAPLLKHRKFASAKLFFDCQMYSPERLCLESVLAANEAGADVANYACVTNFDRIRDGDQVRITGVQVCDLHSGETYGLRGRVTINASGPWADKTMGLLGSDKPARSLIRSKGIHLIVRSLAGDEALAIKTRKGRHFFVLPWRGHTILGTTDEIFHAEPDQLSVTQQDIDAFLEVINVGLPGLNLTRADVLHAYAGLRPLVDEQADSEGSKSESYKASRAAEVVDHRLTDGLRGMMSTVGGKWTTSRALAERAVDQALVKLARPPVASQTHCTPLYGGEIGRYRSFVDRACRRHHTLSPELVANLCRYHGSRLDDVLGASEDAGVPVHAGRTEVIGQVRHAARHEMAWHLEDVIMRRTGIGTLGHPGDAVLVRCAQVMQEELGWDDARVQEELQRVLDSFPIKPMQA